MFRKITTAAHILLDTGVTVTPLVTLEDGVARAHIWGDDGGFRMGLEDGSDTPIVRPSPGIPLEVVAILADIAGIGRQAATPGTAVIRYVGRRPVYRDALYGTGIWEQGQEKEVAVAVADRMSVHRDQYELVGNPGAVIEPGQANEKRNGDEDDTQSVKDQVQVMGLDQLKEFAFVNFGQKLHHSLKEDTARERVILMIDQYGMP